MSEKHIGQTCHYRLPYTSNLKTGVIKSITHSASKYNNPPLVEMENGDRVYGSLVIFDYLTRSADV